MNRGHKIKDVLSVVVENKLFFSALFVLLGLFLSFRNLDFYLDFDFNFLLSLLLSPFVIYVKYKNRLSYRYGYFSLLFLAMYPFLKIQSLYFFGFAFFILFIIESKIGKLNNLPIFLVILLSPIVIFIIEVFGFPLRLWLTDTSVKILSFVFSNVMANGNKIISGEHHFSVDAECMGLKMVITGYILALVIIAYFERKYKKEISFPYLILLFIIASTLIIANNLFRIIAIIFAKSPPETLLHELIGIFSFIIYVIVPFYFITKLVYKKLSQPIKLCLLTDKKKHRVNPVTSNSIGIILLCLLAFLNLNRANYRTIPAEIDLQESQLKGFNCELLDNGVARFTSDSSLVYIKPIPNFYSADHSPLICWKGSGYRISNQRIIEVANHKVYFAELIDEKDSKLYTSWWYQNDEIFTTNQFIWRWEIVKGGDIFNLVNVTCSSIDNLKSETERIILYNRQNIK